MHLNMQDHQTLVSANLVCLDLGCQGVDFISAIHRDACKPKSQTIMCRRKHPPMTRPEKAGAKWER